MQRAPLLVLVRLHELDSAMWQLTMQRQLVMRPPRADSSIPLLQVRALTRCCQRQHELAISQYVKTPFRAFESDPVNSTLVPSSTRGTVADRLFAAHPHPMIAEHADEDPQIGAVTNLFPHANLTP